MLVGTTKCFKFALVMTSSPGTFYGGSCGIALNSTTRMHPRLGLVAGSRGPTQIHPGASATGPVSRRATSAPSHRADEPPGPQAPGKQARLVHTDRTDRSGRNARMRCPGASVLCLSPPLVALLLTRSAIRSGQSHPGLYTQPHQPGSGRRVTVLARSDHSTATEEPAPFVTLLPPTSMHVIVLCGDTPAVVLRSLGDRCERHKRANRAWSARWPASPKGASKVSHEAHRSSEECVGSARTATPQLRIVTIRHGLKVFVIILPCFGHYG